MLTRQFRNNYRVHLLFVLLLAWFGSAAASSTFGELADNCKIAAQLSETDNASPVHKDMHAQVSAAKCWTYIESYQEALAWNAIKTAKLKNEAADLKAILQHLPFCIPDSVTVKQQALIIINHAESNPAHRKWPASAVYGEIMLQHYACQKASD